MLEKRSLGNDTKTREVQTDKILKHKRMRETKFEFYRNESNCRGLSVIILTHNFSGSFISKLHNSCFDFCFESLLVEAMTIFKLPSLHKA